ncbi:crotonobetainyl-CoA:carnitine CoA-transferase CaiB-like acyl-CoA transferase [Spinactinospora alkalitolerans]|uniref:Crotonobetainyl-CoA:carnitine CoA-transferase CaiB-like acyl-CoA transferase n=1 Tax=Spinactinospora alkalitolerans TaxID=687207 RepID=A0A852U105_9ACTN|nr:CoA transferase [Spinactinospora alkalitolerans]NYE48673.1 crotonobetainyl-CoA:carnitine CoA-transferase CaiB-like acyl-CoA transferase [Spinactinospora alkalitolerans]
MSSTDAKPLTGIRVADLSRVLAGPYATMLLADLGAEVVKVEHPGRGDDTRSWGPPWADEEAAYFLSVNRGKRSLAVDVKDPEALDAVAELCARSDVVVQNFRPGVVERLGLGYADVRRRNPGVVYCSISGFGPEHEPAGRPGFDLIVQAESGLMAATGEPGGAAAKVGVAITDVLTGLNAAVSILGALVRARATGIGEHVTVSLINSALSGLASLSQGALVTGEEPQRYGNAHATIVPYQVFPTGDADIVVAAGNDSLYRRLCAVLNRPDLADDPRYATNPQRVAHRDGLVAQISAALRGRTAEEWVKLLMEAGVPVGRVRGVLDAVRAADAAGDGATVAVDHPTAGPLELLRAGFRSASAGGAEEPPLPPPLLGQHSADVLAELGLAEADIARLVERGAVRRGGVR